jgi:hypothetical protein
MLGVLVSVYLLTSPNSIADSAARAMDFVKEDIKPVVQFSMDLAMRGALAVTSTHAFVVLCKRFLGS